jgi:hypothetical protein
LRKIEEISRMIRKWWTHRRRKEESEKGSAVCLKTIFSFNNYQNRKWGWFGTNFSFDARLRRCRVLYYTTIGGSFLILIWTSFSSLTVGTLFNITLLFDAKNLRFFGFRFCGWFGTTAFLGELKDFYEGFFTYYI